MLHVCQIKYLNGEVWKLVQRDRCPIPLGMFCIKWTEVSSRNGAFSCDLDSVDYRHNSTLLLKDNNLHQGVVYDQSS